MTKQLMLVPVPDEHVVLQRGVSMLTQNDLNFMLHGTKESIKAATAARSQMKAFASLLWNQCDKANAETAEAFAMYKKYRTAIKHITVDIKRMERISRTLKQMRRVA